MKENVTKLPKWAQDRIAILERDLAAAQREMRSIYAKEDTGVRILYFPQHDQTMPLPERAQVEFGPKDFGTALTVTLRKDGGVDVHGEGRIAITPWAANSVTIKVAE